MEQIFLITLIKAPIEVCFDLSRNIDFHKQTMKESKEEAVSGVTSGLIELNQRVTWKAKHLGFTQMLTSKITALKFPFHFRDEMEKGIFKSLRHDHYFKSAGGFTVMKDVFEFEAPCGFLGKLLSVLFIKKYLKSLLLIRNQKIKETAENQQWKNFIPHIGNTPV